MGENDRRKTDENPYLVLRMHARSLLGEAGVPSNPGFTDYDIVSELRQKANLPPLEKWNELSDKSFEFYKNALAITMIEAGIILKEPVTEYQNVLRGLDQLRTYIKQLK